MPRTVRDVPPPLELACLRALWRLEEANVKAVQELVGQSRPLAYTTIMTVLDRLVRKGKLTRRKTGRSFVYSPSQTRDSLRRLALRELVDGYFDGSEADLIAFLRNGQVAATATSTTKVPEVEVEMRIDAALL
jgi:predicted transcriptional regulator